MHISGITLTTFQIGASHGQARSEWMRTDLLTACKIKNKFTEQKAKNENFQTCAVFLSFLRFYNAASWTGAVFDDFGYSRTGAEEKWIVRIIK